MTTANSEKKVRVTITARDHVGREESITLMLEASTAKRLEKAANNTTPEGMPESYLRQELNELEDDTKQRMSMPEYCPVYLSPSQYRRLNDFDNLIYHKFYNYSLSINVKW
jgi:hypothetical protein